MTGAYLMTGATGLLGAYLMRDLLAQDVRLAVVIRASKRETPRQRMEEIFVRWERLAGRRLPRPIVLEGDLGQPELGLSKDDQRWVAKNCRGVIHNAASLQFIGPDRSKEPWLSNVQGTANALSLAKATGLREWHQVSTAYVCGLRSGVVRETEVNVGQVFGNDYEASKCRSEEMVRGDSGLDSVTVHRPAIIVGDSRTFYSSTFHGFYMPLKVIASLFGGVANPANDVPLYLNVLGFSGEDRKNFVPVDWVSAVMTRVIADSRHHGRTYHLTPRERVSVVELGEATYTVYAEWVKAMAARRTSPAAAKTLPVAIESFRSQMEVYRAYWRDDPEFDASNTNAVAPDLPCPSIDPLMMRRMLRYALDSDFGRLSGSPVSEDSMLADRLESLPKLAETPGNDKRFVLEVTGPGGGMWTIQEGTSGHKSGFSVERGAADGRLPFLHLNVDTLRRFNEGTVSLSEAMGQGWVVAAHGVSPTAIETAMRRLAAL